MINTPALRRLVLLNALTSLLVASAWHITRIATESPAPTIKIKWNESLSEAERMALEGEFQLVNAEEIGPRSYNYDLIDSRAPVIRAIVEHPAVDDTADLDRQRFTVAPTTEPGDAKRWLWHRSARDENAQRVSLGLNLWLVVSVMLGLITRRVARVISADSAKRIMAQTDA